MREIPVSGTPLDQVNARETVRLLGKNADGTWYLLVTPRNITGWVSASLLTIDAAVAADVPVAEGTRGSVASVTTAWKTHTINQSTLTLPPSWQPLPLSKADLETFATALAPQNPQMAELVRGLVTSGQYQQIEFFALDTSATSVGANVSLVSVPRPADVAAETILEQTVSALPSALPDAKLISGDTKHQSGGFPAGRIVYDLPLKGAAGNQTIRGVQWYIVSSANIHVVTVSGSSDDALITLADQIAQSFTTNDVPSEASSGGERRQVINGGNLRREAKVAASNVIGQVCPGDQLVLLDSATTPNWAKVRVVTTGPDCDPKRVALGTEGWLSVSLVGPAPEGNAAQLPPSLPVTKLVPFTHESSGISGVRPDNWTIFSSGTSFQISSSPEAPDGFVGRLITPDAYPAGGAVAASRTALDGLKKNQAEGTAPTISEDKLDSNGNGTILATVSGVAQGSTKPIRLTIYARTTVTSRGVLVAIAVVPADVFPQEEQLVRQMVDSLKVQ